MARITTTTYRCDACDVQVEKKRDLTRVEVRVGASYRVSVDTVAELCAKCLGFLDEALDSVHLLRESE